MFKQSSWSDTTHNQTQLQFARPPGLSQQSPLTQCQSVYQHNSLRIIAMFAHLNTQFKLSHHKGGRVGFCLTWKYQVCKETVSVTRNLKDASDFQSTEFPGRSQKYSCGFSMSQDHMAVSRELSNSDKEICSSNSVRMGERVESGQICLLNVRIKVPLKCLFGVVQISTKHKKT